MPQIGDGQISKILDSLKPMQLKILVDIGRELNVNQYPERVQSLLELQLITRQQGQLSLADGVESALDTWLDQHPAMLRLVYSEVGKGNGEIQS